MAKIYVFNSVGEKELFSPQKVYKSARRAGASKDLARKIVEWIEPKVWSGMKTLEIYKEVKKVLYQENPGVNLKFSLKVGMRKLGPSGFPFEKFVGEIFTRLGFEVKTNIYLSGSCLRDYEIDFLAKKGSLVYIGECKYRNIAGDKVHLDNVLANQARFLDLLDGSYFKTDMYKGCKIKSIMVTNERFTSRAITYSDCQGIELLGWRHPHNKGLEYLIESNNLYPITILPSLKGHLKDVLVLKETMLAKDILTTDIENLSKKLGVLPKYLYSVINEARLLLAK
ncbi:MAG: hypothetical protein COU70_00065 [Parcubacteria group bacterium CG10_big_fil_rev_8_21_14_0_10_35_15]|nr:MAG: hypothetical protein COU70_00065 [Parcubacteria group bacterium CG10_big_fil_rev_8_21_14_0_10_35_15]